ncbi:AAA family ATPase [Nonomuraea sp. NPDC049607]|uniref:helix-turn-helix transcriptional regulator n=1 Tax=unclassified Nonomuraea TaxID=2593643 RepID=UPI0034396FE1
MHLIEREYEVELLKYALAESDERRGHFALIVAPTGFGKTRLLHALNDLAMESDITCISATCLRDERAVPFGLVNQLYQELRLLGLTEGSTSQRGGGEAEESGSLDLAYELWNAMAGYARNRTLLIAVDDVQYADSPSLRILHHFVGRMHNARIFLALTANEDATGVASRVETNFLYHPLCVRVRLNPLSPAGASQMLVQDAEGKSDEQFVADMHQLTGGNPLLIRALIEQRQHVDGDIFAGSLRTLLHRSGPTALRTAQGVAVLGSASTPHLLAEMLEIEIATVERILQWLETVGVLESTRFRHPVARTAVLASLERAASQDLHWRAAKVLYSAGCHAGLVAEYLLEGGGQRAGWALDVLREAADQAMASHEFNLAVKYFRVAAELCGDGDQRVPITMSLAKAEWLLNPARAISHTPLLLQAAEDELLRESEIHWLLMCMLWHGRTAEAAQLYERLRAMFQESEGSQARVGVWYRSASAWLASTYPPLLRMVRGAHDPAYPTGVPQAQHGEDLHERAVVALRSNLRHEEGETALKTAERILQSVQLDECMVETVESALFSLVYTNQAEQADAWAEALYGRAERHRAPTWISALAAFRAHIAITMEDLPLAVEHALNSLQMLPAHCLGVRAALPLASLIEANRQMGRPDQVERYIHRPLAKSVFQTRYGLHYLTARARYLASIDQPDAARRDILKCGKLMCDWGLDNPLLSPWRLDAAAISVELKDNAYALALLDEHGSRWHAETPWIKAASLTVLASTEEVSRRPRLLRQAIDILLDAGRDVQLVNALMQLGYSLAVLGEADQASLVIREADSLAKKCKAAPVRNEVSVIAENSFNVVKNTLTPSEHRVALMAALGYTNREISSRMHITASTVEQHLTSTYRKLNVKGRKDLPLLLSSS